MVQQSRRTLLAALAGVTAIAGCSGDEPSSATESEQPSESPSATTESSTPTPEPIEASELTFVGSVVRQPSSEAPGKVRASLTNRSGGTLHLLGGHLMPVSGGIADGPDETLLLLPDESDRINEYSWTKDGDPIEEAVSTQAATYDGCWRAPGDGFRRTDLADAAELADEGTVDAEFYPLAAAGADCPNGRYTVREQLSVEGTGQTVRTQLAVDVGADGRLAAEGSLTVDDA